MPDNWRTGVTNPCHYEPDLNSTYRDLADHYGTVILPARPRKPRDKAKVEAGVLVVERWITGPTGIGKTYLCCALLEKACRQGHTAYYASTQKFFRTLAVAYADGSFDKLLSKIARIDILAIDDRRITPLGDRERRYFLEVLEDRYESRSTILISQYPIDAWHDLVGNPTLADAILEHILHRSHRIELQGESMRRLSNVKESKEVQHD